MKKEKTKLPFGLTIYTWEKTETNKSSGNVRRFLNLEIREGKKFVYSLYKCVELNGEPCDEDWKG